MSEPADPDLVAAWLRGRSIAGNLPVPVAESDGWRLETGSETEVRRYVFAAPSPAIAELARTTDRPRVFLKACVDGNVLSALLTPAWRVCEPTWMMTGPSAIDQRPLADGYTATIDRKNGVIAVRITAADGTLAASGYAAETQGAFVYDRIIVSPEHQRRGLGGAMMAILGRERRSRDSCPVLVATDQGRALYLALGWQLHAPYATAVIPDPVA
ncbi:GNAT family N-acetyltransferase [Sphingomonas sp. GB1N7]|uniref:GNAT family N-acetyltransferase n=1 Tax=Parasphingomonas caseinilytica TaxID=3096158 RepID=UPI002FCCAF65